MHKKTNRPGILSLHERDLIKEVDRIRSGQQAKIKRAASRLSQVLPDLDRRISALAIDLEIILASNALRPFVASRIKDLSLIAERYQVLQKLHVGEDYSTWRVRYTRKSPYNEKKLQRVRRYWLDVSDENKPEKFGLENVFSPEYALRDISGKWVTGGNQVVDTREILLEAVKLEMRYRPEIINHEKYDDAFCISGILPKTELDAIPLYEIREQIKHFPHRIEKLEEYRRNKASVRISRGKYEEIMNIKDLEKRRAALEETYNYFKGLDNSGL